MSSLSTIQEKTPLSRAFFSNVNVDTIQKQIRYEVWQKSNEKYVIGEQDPTQLQNYNEIFLSSRREKST